MPFKDFRVNSDDPAGSINVKQGGCYVILIQWLLFLIDLLWIFSAVVYVDLSDWSQFDHYALVDSTIFLSWPQQKWCWVWQVTYLVSLKFRLVWELSCHRAGSWLSHLKILSSYLSQVLTDSPSRNCKWRLVQLFQQLYLSFNSFLVGLLSNFNLVFCNYFIC